MNGEQRISTKQGSDSWVAIAVVACLAAGGLATYWLTRPAPPPVTVKTMLVEGAPIVPPKPPKAADENKSITSPPVSVPAPSTPAPVASQPPPPAPVVETNGANDGEFLPVTFGTLGSFLYDVPDSQDILKANGKPKDQIPQPIHALNNKKVAVQGFMVPLKIDKGMTRVFFLVKDQSLCCYGRMPRMNELVKVTMHNSKATRFIGDQPVTVFGRLEVGEELEEGNVMSVYRLDAEDVAGPLDL